ncbi:ribosomal protein S18-alanine N-acetyltransferase [Ideonella oryzae]|uniref:[Ribosomal protein bS18]-alanine N-acetyltransferase n=1 Tax=Ideonella oryzae TaxID=2937441 RepID=A0ABT1BLL3_9BURK|nr:ribosomal protein S18-alanine N-acetyltransferase [Ideonella oryzae]MCO5977118.1 ribosomal protein S18-alanine N-acetyltransferase [Ideonella oryzae]
MTVSDLDEVVAIEHQAYAFPWTRGNFIDSLAVGHPAWLLRGPADGALWGYYVAMGGVEEMHLLNITVAPAQQGQGHARRMLDHLGRLAHATGALQLWLEVRESNARARQLYERNSFVAVGRRKAYYPAVQGREDAVVMCRPVKTKDGGEAGHAVD